MNTLRLCLRTVVVNKGLTSTTFEARRYIKRWVSPMLKFRTQQIKELGPRPEPVRSNFIEWNRQSELYAFNKRLSESFSPEMLEQAMVHKSYIFHEEHKQRQMGISDPKLDLLDNEELFREGEQMTSKIVEDYLRQSLPRVPEEGIIAIHDYLLSEEILSKAASHIGTKDLILCEEQPPSQETMAKTFMALVSALAHSVDINHSVLFVRDFLISGLAEKDLTEIWCPSDPMEMLSGILSDSDQAPIEPRLIGDAGTNTLLPVYHVGLYSNKQFLGAGFGQTVKEAKDAAALYVLYRMFDLSDSSQPIRYNKKIDMSAM